MIGHGTGGRFLSATGARDTVLAGHPSLLIDLRCPRHASAQAKRDRSNADDASLAFERDPRKSRGLDGIRVQLDLDAFQRCFDPRQKEVMGAVAQEIAELATLLGDPEEVLAEGS